jgi:hypothetical protein
MLLAVVGTGRVKKIILSWCRGTEILKKTLFSCYRWNRNSKEDLAFLLSLEQK